jgi:hypothetical protein
MQAKGTVTEHTICLFQPSSTTPSRSALQDGFL